MNALTETKAGCLERTPAGFEEQLIWLQRFGQPRVMMMSKGWVAAIEMNTNTTGTSFEVKSEFDHATPSQALRMLIERMLAALAAVGAAR